ncbi:MAG: VWA domain-containing protein [Acidobacteriota bacterium]|nr:VWA domain-containing protein [Acidobacteriota bacterium]
MKKWQVLLVFTAVGLIASTRAAPKPTPRQAGLISTNTRLVRLLVLVFDNKGARATGLTDRDFRVLDNGVEQRITYFSNLREPVSVVLAADDSRSMYHKIPFVREALDTLLDPYPSVEVQRQFRDEFALVRFATRAERATRFMTGEELEPWINRLVQPTDGNTALFDAIYLSTAVAHKGSNKRRAIILVTDGGDNNSRYSLKETRRFVEETDVPVFAIMASPSLLPQWILPEGPKEPPIAGPQTEHPPISPDNPLIQKIEKNNEDVIGPAERRGPHNMKVLTEASGGAVFTARRLTDLPRIVRAIGQAIRYAYLIAYEPPAHMEKVSRTSSPGANGWHTVKVSLVPAGRYKGYAIYAKDGYFDDQIP